eukprot:scaffold9993_cov101-Isochrysis_galbana.AAC.11
MPAPAPGARRAVRPQGATRGRPVYESPAGPGTQERPAGAWRRGAGCMPDHNRFVPNHNGFAPNHNRSVPEHNGFVPNHNRLVPDHNGFAAKPQ